MTTGNRITPPSDPSQPLSITFTTYSWEDQRWLTVRIYIDSYGELYPLL